jgi:hypothetical protein
MTDKTTAAAQRSQYIRNRVILATSVFIHLYYYETLPSAPDERGGRTFKMEVNHGFVRYGSGGELRAFHLVQDVLFPVGFFPFLAAGALGLKWGIFKVRGAREA